MIFSEVASRWKRSSNPGLRTETTSLWWAWVVVDRLVLLSLDAAVVWLARGRPRQAGLGYSARRPR